MNKLFTKIAALALGAVMAVGVGVAVASGSKANAVQAATGLTQDVAYTDFSGGTSSSGSEMSGTVGAFTITFNKGYRDTTKTYTQSYAGGEIEFEGNSTVTKITGISITASSSSYNGAQNSGAWSVLKSGSGSVSASGATITYSSGTDTTITLGHSKQLRWTAMVITYDSSSGGGGGGGDTLPASGSVSLNKDTFGVTGSYSNKTYTIYGVTFNADDAMLSDSKLTLKASSSGAVYNSTALTGRRITSVNISNISFSSSTNAGFYVYGGNSSKATTTTFLENSGSTTNVTVSFDGYDYTYFYIKNKTTRQFKFAAVVNFETPGEKVAVTFDVQGHGTAPSNQSVAVGGKVTQPSNPTETGYTFGGWYKEAGCTNAWNFSTDTVSVATTLYAKWTINSYQVTFDVQGHGTAPSNQSISYGGKVTQPSNPTATGYTFSGWYKEAGCTNAWNFSTDTVSAATTLYAKWTETSYTVSSDTSGLTVSTDSIPASGGDITLTTAARKKGTDVTVSGTATKTINENVVSFTSVSSNISISATIVDATPTLNVTGQKTSFKLDESFSFGGTVTKTYDDWVSPHTTDTIEAANYTVDSSDFVAGTVGTYTIVVSHSGAEDLEYEVTVSNVQEKTDELTLTSFGNVSGYNSYSAVGTSTNTAYAGYLTANSTNMQFKSKDSVSGIVNTNTKGTVKSVSVTWDSSTTAGQVLDIYGSSTAYTAPSELYGNSSVGDKVGSITYGTTTSYTFEDDYEYVGIRSNSGAHYIQSISIVWLVEPKSVHHIGASEVTESGPFYVGTKPTLAELGVTVTAYYDAGETDSDDVTSLATISYPLSGLTDDNNGGDGYTISYGGKTTTIDITAEVGDVYAKLNTVTDLIAGSTVRIATASYVMGTTNTGSSTQLDYVSGNAEVASLSGTANLTVSADKDGYYFSYEDNSTTYYLYCNNAENAVLGFTTTLALNAHWHVSINNIGVADITNAEHTARYLRSNTSTHRFACFASGQDSVSFYQLVDNDMTAAQKVAAQIDTFGKLYLHKSDIAISEESRSSSGTTCNGYYDKAKTALSGDWSPIQENFSQDTSGMWERYCAWAWATYGEIPSFSGGEMKYSKANILSISLTIGNSSNTVAIIAIISMISATVIGGYFFLRKRKEN